MSHEQVFIVMDSADRKNPVSSTPSDYVYSLPTTLRNVFSIELLSLQMIRADPNLYADILPIQVTVNNTTTTCMLTQTEVTSGSQLASIIQTALIVADPSFLVTYSSVSNRMNITCPRSFSISIVSGLSRLSGFVGDGYRGGGNISSVLLNGVYKINGMRVVDLLCEPYLIMYINDYDRNTSASSAIENSYIIIPMEERKWMQRFIMCNDEKEKKGTYLLTGNQTRLSDIRVKFTRPDGSLYNFQGTDHQITFRVNRNGHKDYTT